MIAELLVAGAVQLGGVAFALAGGLRRARLVVPLGFIAGISLLVIVSFGQAFLLDRILVLPTLLVVALAPVVWLAVVWRRSVRGTAPRGSLLGAGLSVPGAVLLSGLLAAIAPVNFHTDSFEYLTIGQQLTEHRFHVAVSIAQLEKRGLGVPALHAPGVLDDDIYVESVMPMLALACLALVAVFASEGLRLRLSRGWTVAIAVGAGLLLLSLNRFVFNAFYLNGHLLFAVLLLVLAGGSWVGAVHRAAGLERQLLPIQLVAIPALVATRPEAGIAALIVLAPTLLDGGRALWQRIALAAATGASIAVWQSFLVYETLRRSTDPNKSMLGLLALGLLVCAVCWLLRFRWLTGRRRLWLWIGELGLWAALVVLALRSPDILWASLDAAFQNIVVGTGGWGITLDALALIALVVIVLLRDEQRIHLRYAVTTFVPLIFLLAFLRETAYRVHPADSMNRMAFQIVPLAVLLIAAGAGAAWVWARRRAADPASAAEAQPVLVEADDRAA